MKKFIKVLAAILTVATFATIPAMAEAPAAESNAAEEQASIAAADMYGANIEDVAAQLGIERYMFGDESDNSDSYAMYDNEDIVLIGSKGVIRNITVFDAKYDVYGVRTGMTVDEAKAALDACGIAYKDDMLEELEEPMLVFEIPGHDDAEGYFDIYDGKIADAHIESREPIGEDE